MGSYKSVLDESIYHYYQDQEISKTITRTKFVTK